MTEDRICEWCGKLYTIAGNPRRRKYCSKECYTLAHNSRHWKVKPNPNKKRFADQNMRSIKTGGLDETLAEAKERGMTFAEIQTERTLRRVRNGEL